MKTSRFIAEKLVNDPKALVDALEYLIDVNPKITQILIDPKPKFTLEELHKYLDEYRPDKRDRIVVGYDVFDNDDFSRSIEIQFMYTEDNKYDNVTIELN